MGYAMITEDHIAAYERDGVVAIRSALAQGWIYRLRDAVQELIEDPGPRMTKDASKGGCYIYDTFMWTRSADLRELHQSSPLPEMAARLMRSEKTFLLVDSMFIKEAGTRQSLEWHQDQPVGWYNGQQVCAIWIPLDDVTLESGAVEYVRGSHLAGQWYIAPKQNKDLFGSKGSPDAPMPDIDNHRPELDIIHFDTQPGDVLFHNLLVLHGSPANTASRRRRALSLRYGGDDATFAIRPGGLRPILDPGLVEGDHFGTGLFPQIWPPAAPLEVPAQIADARA